jgi:glycosyltransferase involved in cell wall biosynthesis
MRLVRVAINLEQLLYRSPGGIGRYTAQLAMVLPRLFPDDEVLGFTARHRPTAVRAALAAHGVIGPEPSVLPLPRPLLYEAWHRFGAPPLSFGAQGLGRAEIVHAPSVAVPPRGRAPLVVTVFDVAVELFPDAFPPRGLRFHRAGLAAAARRADLVLTASQAAAEEIVAHSSIRSDRIRVVPNGVDPVELPEATVRRVAERAGVADRPFVLWVGTLVAAMAALHRRRPSPARLVLAGYPGWLTSDLVDPADRAELGDDLVELGRVDEEVLWGLYAAAAVFAFPSLHEGFGYPVLEAMTQATPVVCSDLPVLRELTGDAAVTAAPGDVGAWAEALAGVLDDPAAATDLGEAGQARSREWTVERSIRATRAVYSEALGGGV